MSDYIFPDGAVIMADAPVDDSPEEIFEIYKNDSSEANLAKCYADVSNQSGWLSFDVDETDCSEEIKKALCVWLKLEEKLFLDIKNILIQENENGAKHVVEGIGQYYIVKPFIERNGYSDGAGWWISNEI